MVNGFSLDDGDINKWTKSMRKGFEDPKKQYYLGKFFEDCKIPRPEGERKHFQHITVRPITCNFK